MGRDISFNKEIKENQIPGILYLRGLAALGVVLCHYGSNLSDYKELSKFFNMGQLGIHVFFLISGFVIIYSLLKNGYTPKDLFKFLLKRVVRIDPAYIITILLTLLTFFVLRSISSFKGAAIPFIPQQFLAHIFYVVPFTNWSFYNSVFWTLCVEFQFYILVGCIYFLSKNTWFRFVFLMLFSLSTLLPLPNKENLIFNYAPIFAVGMALIHYYFDGKKVYLIPILFSGALIYIKFGFTVFVLLICTVLIIFFVKKYWKLLAFLGNISYSLYLTHSLVLIYLTGILKRIPVINSYGNQLIILLMEVIIAIICGYLFYICVEKPSILYSKKVSYRFK